jgi:hypothetical protein
MQTLIVISIWKEYDASIFTVEMSTAINKYLKQANEPATINWTSNQQIQFRYAMRQCLQPETSKILM